MRRPPIRQSEVEAVLGEVDKLASTRGRQWQAKPHPDYAELRLDVAFRQRSVELVITLSRSEPDHYSFSLLLRAQPILRWDFTGVPHPNKRCPNQYPPGSVPCPHEHLFRDATKTRCVTALHSIPAGFDARFKAFLHRSSIVLSGSLPTPPALQSDGK